MPLISKREGSGRRLILQLVRHAVDYLLPIAAAWLLAGVLYARIHPPPRFPDGSEFGAIRLNLRLPGTAEGVPEPLVVCGVPGRASLVYIRLLSRARAKVGIEFWGLTGVESEIFALPSADAQITLECSLPALLPPVGDRHWGAIARPAQEERHAQYRLTVDGVNRLQGSIDYPQPPHARVYIGANPVGGSLVTNRFTGKVLRASQAF